MGAPRRLLACLIALFLVASAPQLAEAKAKVEVGSVDYAPAKPDKAKEKRVRQAVRRSAARAAKHLDFGPTGKVEVSFVVRELAVEEDGDVVKVTCTLVGRLKGGGTARSKIRFGGKRSQRSKLEREVISAATDGVMTRLAEIAKQERAEAAS